MDKNTSGLGNNLEQYSQPLKHEVTKLAVLIWLNPRQSSPGREWMPVYDARFPLIEGFEVKFAYCNKMFDKSIPAGRHYHLNKKEIIVPINGRFELSLQDVKSGENESILLDSKDNVAVYIRPGISHKVVLQSDAGTLLVLASTHSSVKDEIRHDIG